MRFCLLSSAINNFPSISYNFAGGSSMELKPADYMLLNRITLNVSYLNYPFGKILPCVSITYQKKKNLTMCLNY
jgi:hypothetical protein